MKNSIASLLIYSLAISSIFYSCQGKQGDPGPAGINGNANVYTGLITVSGLASGTTSGWTYTGSSSTGWTFNYAFKFGTDVYTAFDTTSSFKVDLQEIQYSSSSTASSVDIISLPYVDKNDFQHSYKFSFPYLSNFKSLVINIKSLNSTVTSPGTFVYQYTIIPRAK